MTALRKRAARRTVMPAAASSGVPHRAENIEHGAVALRGIGAQAGNGDAAARESDGAERRFQQGDRAVLDILRAMGAWCGGSGCAITVRRGTLHGAVIDAAPVPDLIPALCSFRCGGGRRRVVNAARLRPG